MHRPRLRLHTLAVPAVGLVALVSTLAPAAPSLVDHADPPSAPSIGDHADPPAAHTRTVTTSSRPDGAASGAPRDAVWERLARCASGGNWSINTGNGRYGGLQLGLVDWQEVGGHGYPHRASRAEQIRRAELLLVRRGWDAWPDCARLLGHS